MDAHGPMHEAFITNDAVIAAYRLQAEIDRVDSQMIVYTQQYLLGGLPLAGTQVLDLLHGAVFTVLTYLSDKVQVMFVYDCDHCHAQHTASGMMDTWLWIQRLTNGLLLPITTPDPADQA